MKLDPLNLHVVTFFKGIYEKSWQGHVHQDQNSSIFCNFVHGLKVNNLGEMGGCCIGEIMYVHNQKIYYFMEKSIKH